MPLAKTTLPRDETEVLSVNVHRALAALYFEKLRRTLEDPSLSS